MKTFDVFLRDSPTNMDVFLKDRLISMDVIIQTLMQREILTFDSKLFIDCIANELSLIKWIGGAASMEIRTELDRLLEQLTIFAKSLISLDADADIIGQKAIAGKSDMFLKTATADTLLKVYDNFNNFQTILAELDSYSVRLYLGNTNICNYIGTSSVNAGKITYPKADNDIILIGDVSFSGKKVISPSSQKMQLSVERVGLFNMALISCNTLMNIVAKETMGLDLRSVLHGSGFDMTLHTGMLDSAVLNKSVSVNNKVQLLASVVWMLNKVIYPHLIDVNLSCEANAGLYRYRLLSEMDENNLLDYDNMSLRDIDYVSLE